MSAWLTGEIGLSIVTNFLREKHYKKNKICDQQIFNELLAVNLASLIARYGSIEYEYSKYKYRPSNVSLLLFLIFVAYRV